MTSSSRTTRNPGFKPGDHWVQCDKCSKILRSSKARITWDNLIVCPKDWEPRHPQDMIRSKEDNQAAKGLVRPESDDVFIDVTFLAEQT